MASKITLHLSLAVLVFAVMTSFTYAELKEVKETSMTLYFQDQYAGHNATVLQINTGLSDDVLSFSKFGSMFVTDDIITQGFHVTSAQVARGQGLYVTSAIDGTNTHVLISIVFKEGEYKGSTLEVQGASAQFEKVREVAIVGGTGGFRFARGYMTFETVHIDVEAHLAVIQCNITVQHY